MWRVFSNRYSVRFLLVRTLIPASVLLAPLSASAAEPVVSPQLQAAVAAQATGELQSYYTYEAGPLWVGADGALAPAAQLLVQLIETADLDGLDPSQLGVTALREAVLRAEVDRSPEALAEAEVALSTALSSYALALLRTDDSLMIYEHDVLRPILASPATVMRGAASAPSLTDYVRNMSWMHPLYGQLRQQLLAEENPSVRQGAIANLQRLRAIPAPYSRHVLIDAANARLWMYENGQPVDSMKVVVGRPDAQTPMMAGYIRYATLNPYWNVPADLVRKTIATGVINQGVPYLKARGYEVLSGWGDDAVVLDPKSIDWPAVKRGELEPRVRQKPSRANAMGNVKYEFPNPQGIYLHDTPEKSYMLKAVRQLSNGCVRLEDAERLGRWLLGGELPRDGAGPEQRVDLAEPVPIYITYITATLDDTGIALGPDPYSLDVSAPAPALARVQ